MNAKKQRSSLRHIELWVEFYLLALSNQDLAYEVAQSKDYYKRWGDPAKIRPASWVWINCKLFIDKKEVTLFETIPTEYDSDYIYLAVPKHLPITRIIEQLEGMIYSSLMANNVDQEILERAKAPYTFTESKEMKVENMFYALNIYKLYRLQNCPPINERFLDFVTKNYQEKFDDNLPSTLHLLAGKSNLDSVLRTIRRYIQKAKLLEKNAAKGDFPGQDYTD